MGFLSDACDHLAAEPVEPRQLDLALPASPQERMIPPEVPPPHYYRIADRMLSPSFLHGTVEGPMGADGRFLRETVLDADAPPAGTIMRFKFHTFPGERHSSDAIVVAAELQAWEDWQRHLADVAVENERWPDLVDRATKENDARDFNLALGVPAPWQPAAKIALNALYEGSGSGSRSSTVNHVQLLEPMIAGRIKRGAGDLLCGAKAGTQGLSTEWSPVDERTPVLRASCSACLRVAERFRCAA